MAGPQVSGSAVALGVAGSVLVLSAIRNVSIAETLRALLQAKPVPAGPDELADHLNKVGRRVSATGLTDGGIGGGSATGTAVAETALTYIGVPYVWGGETPDGWDCSGFVTWVLHKEHGIALPDNFHTMAIQFYGWSGAVTVPRAQCQAGDLVCWPSHIGIAVSNTEMVHAPGAGQQTRRQKIWGVPAPVIRRPRAYTGPVADQLRGAA